MATYFDVHRFVTIATVVVLACGCRNASWKTQAGYLKNPRSSPVPTYSNSDLTSEPPLPAPRYSEQSRNLQDESLERPYIGDESSSPSLAPHPESPSVLTTPRDSDSNESSLPPTPTAKKSRWNLIPSGFKRPSSNKYIPDGQSSDEKVDRKWPGKLAKSTPTGRDAAGSRSGEETATSRNLKWSHSAATSIESAGADTSDDAEMQPPIPSASERTATVHERKTGTAPAIRYQANNYFKSPTRNLRSGPSLDPVARPLADSDASRESHESSEADMPLLLPPGN